MATFLLYESASGYALFEGLDMDEIGQTAEAVQETITCVETAAPFSVSCCRGNNSPIIGPRPRARAFARPGNPIERRRGRCALVQLRGLFGSQTRAPLRTANPSSRGGREESVDRFFRFASIVCVDLRRCRRGDRGSSHVFLLKACLLRDPLDLLLTSPPPGRVAVT